MSAYRENEEPLESIEERCNLATKKMTDLFCMIQTWRPSDYMPTLGTLCGELCKVAEERAILIEYYLRRSTYEPCSPIPVKP